MCPAGRMSGSAHLPSGGGFRFRAMSEAHSYWILERTPLAGSPQRGAANPRIAHPFRARVGPCKSSGTSEARREWSGDEGLVRTHAHRGGHVQLSRCGGLPGARRTPDPARRPLSQRCAPRPAPRGGARHSDRARSEGGSRRRARRGPARRGPRGGGGALRRAAVVAINRRAEPSCCSAAVCTSSSPSSGVDTYAMARQHMRTALRHTVRSARSSSLACLSASYPPPRWPIASKSSARDPRSLAERCSNEA